MVAWVVNDRLHPRRTPPSSFLLPASLGPIPILELTPPSSLKKYPLSFQFFLDTPTQRPLTNPFAINSLRPLFIATGGVHLPSIFFGPPPTARAPQFLAPATWEALP